MNYEKFITFVLLMAIGLVTIFNTNAIAQQPVALRVAATQADAVGYVRVVAVKCVATEHPVSKEEGVAVAIRGIVFDRTGDEITICMWSKDNGYIGYPFKIRPNADFFKFFAAIFISTNEIKMTDLDATQIHFRSVKTGKLLGSIK